MAYVYRHLRDDTDEVFYIGIGSDSKYKRAYDDKGRNRYWTCIFNKVGRSVEIIEDALTWEEACEREKYWIKFYGRKDLKEGNLVNMTDGGDGGLGVICSDETRKKLSNAAKNMSDETREQRRLAWIGNTINTGRTLSDEHKRNIGAGCKGKIGWSKGLTKETCESIKAQSEKKKGNPAWNSGKIGVYTDETLSKMRLARIGKTMSVDTKQKISNSGKGHTVSDETRTKISDRRKGHTVSDETRAKISNKNKGKVRSDEFKKKVGESVRLYHSNKNNNI
jgi:hypothetical protein